MQKNKLLIIFCFVLIITQSCGNKESKSIKLFNNKISKEFKCPNGSIVEVDGWGKSGLSHSCKMKHGKFVGWEYGRKIVEGNYNYGVHIGQWKWFDEKGQIELIKNYNINGKLIEEIDYTKINSTPCIDPIQ